MYITVYSESFWKILWGEFSALKMILTQFYIFHTEVQIHIVGKLQFRFAMLKADHFDNMAKSTIYDQSCTKRGDALPRNVKLNTISIPVLNRVFMVITHVCCIVVWTMYHSLLYYVLHRIHISYVVVMRIKYYNPLKPCISIVYTMYIYLSVGKLRCSCKT